MSVSRHPSAIAGSALLLVALILLAGCARTPPEQALREALTQVQGAIQARDAAALDDWLAEDFVGPDGLDRTGARRLALAMFMRYRDVGVVLGPVDIRMQPGHASVRFSAVLSGGSGRLLPESGRIYEVETGWRLENGDWRMTSAAWESRL